MKKPDETANLRVLRKGSEHEFSIKLQPVCVSSSDFFLQFLTELQVRKLDPCFYIN